MNKEELATEYAKKRFDLKGYFLYGCIYEQGFLAGYHVAEQDARERAVKAFREVIGKYHYPSNTAQSDVEQFLTHYDND